MKKIILILGILFTMIYAIYLVEAGVYQVTATVNSVRIPTLSTILWGGSYTNNEWTIYNANVHFSSSLSVGPGRSFTIQKDAVNVYTVNCPTTCNMIVNITAYTGGNCAASAYTCRSDGTCNVVGTYCLSTYSNAPFYQSITYIVSSATPVWNFGAI